mgnify:CR=1 FL=1
MNSLAPHLDLANHHANAAPKDIKKLCADVVSYSLHAAFVNPCYITLAKEALAGKAPVGTAISFPLGQETVSGKRAAANEAVQLGADELDVVPNLGLFLSGDKNGFLSEMAAIAESARMPGKPVIVKFIIETGYLTDGQIGEAAQLVVQSGADFVKICSGMGPRGASTHDVEVVRAAVGPDVKIKVAGGIDTRGAAEAMLAAGANRIGTSHAVQIIS